MDHRERPVRPDAVSIEAAPMTRMFTADQVSAIVKKRLDQVKVPHALVDAISALLERLDELDARVAELEGKRPS